MSSPSPPLTPPTSDSEEELNACDDPGVDSIASTSQLLSRPFPRSTSISHPFAASTKANRAPPLYEKKAPVTPPATPPELLNKHSSVEIREVQRQDSRTSPPPPSPRENEQNLWDRAISSAIDAAEQKVDLSDSDLTYIPPSVLDLKHLVVLPKVARSQQISLLAPPRSFQRSATAPALLPSPHIPNTRRFLPTVTTSALGSIPLFGRQQFESHKSEIELYLMRNAIRILPRELFGLDCLVVLILRQNKLTSLPPAIGQLKRLRELNVASNRLTFLPAEIMELRLKRLHLHPNPFTPPPPGSSDTKATRNFGPIERGSSMPTLSEYMLRFLLSSATSRARHPTRIEVSAQPLYSLQLPDHLLRILRASTGHGSQGSQYESIDAKEDVTANKCPNPSHARRAMPRNADVSDGTFRIPVETMVEWVGVVAGIQVAESPQAWVPVLWRGCSKGCLSFLRGEEETDEDVAFTAGTGEDGELFEFSDEE